MKLLRDGLRRENVPLPIGENLSLSWTPERGFDHDPTEWLCRRRCRLSTSPGMTGARVVCHLGDAAPEHMEELHRQIEEEREKGTPDPDDFDIPGNLEALEDLV